VRELIGAREIRASFEVSADLNSWMPAGMVLISTTDLGDGTLRRRYRTELPFNLLSIPRMFLRLAVVRTD
jgi:hypothetical protein